MSPRVPPLALVATLLAVALLAMPAANHIRQRDEAPVQPRPPGRAGGWSAEPIAYCHTAGCGKEWRGPAAAGPDCPSCHGPLSGMSVIERNLLPGDTSLHKAFYTTPAAPALVVSIVISGRDRSSIHRPEVCLVGQGSDLAGSFVHTVDRPGRDPLRVTVLELVRRVPQPDGSEVVTPTYYAYWFAGTRGRETPSHYRRMAWMAFDRIARGESSRWAYIAVGGTRRDAGRDYLRVLDAFLRDLAPALAPGPA